MLARFAVSREPWQEGNACGANCLFVLLRLYGCAVTHEEVVSGLPRESRGSHLGALQDYAVSRGVRAEVCRATPAVLDRLPLPAIAHLGEGANDHFVVLCAVTERQVQVLDGTRGQLQWLDKGAFEHQWSGYMLLAQEPPLVELWHLGIWALAGWLLAWLMVNRLGRRASTLILIVAGLLGPVSVGHARGDAAPSEKSADLLIEGLVQTYERLRLLPGLEVEYRIEHEALEKRSAELWAWPWAEVSNVIKPSAPGKAYLRFRHPETYRGKAVVNEVQRSSDNDLRVMHSRWQEGGPGRAAIRSNARDTFDDIAGFSYYFRYLAHPISATPDAGEAARRLFPPGSYWLPEALQKNRAAYRVAPQQEKVSEVWCHVLERPGLDKLWVQTEPMMAIRRRLFHWEAGKGVRQDAVFEDLTEVSAGLWLPRRIVFDYYTAPWDDPPLQGRIASRHRLKVSRLVVEDFPDSRFRAQIPVGAEVNDSVSSNNPDQPVVFINQPGVDPFERALAGLTPHNRWPRRLLLSASALLAAVCIVFIVNHVRRRKPRAQLGDSSGPTP